MVPKTVRSETPSIAEAAVDGDCVTASEVFDDHVEHGNLEMGSCSAGVVSKESSRPNTSLSGAPLLRVRVEALVRHLYL